MAESIGWDGKIYGIVGHELKSPEVDTLAEYKILVNELEGALLNIRRLYSVYPLMSASAGDSAIGQALFRDAVVQFVGCFGKSQKRPLLDPKVVYAGDTQALEFFRYLEDLRDTFAAHNFGPARLAVVTLMPTWPIPGGAVNSKVYRFSGPGRDYLPQYGRLIWTALKECRKLMLAASRAVANQAAAMGTAAILKLPSPEVYVPRHDQIRRSRDDHRAKPLSPAPLKRG